ncbi:phosphatidylglycerophosphatase A [Dyella sp. C9]|uniref:phosphatidylglycerophosphatase A family protein n=1 Tax=Dyella sp. C9 TaxID=2202154 RepID=UPI000DF01434|nr:phosphatidylglycerophosphatase A [Dyella sp. C9]
MSDKTILTPEQRRLLLATPAGWLACGFGSGLAPVAQGTFGSLAALLPWLLLRSLPLQLYVFAVAVAFVIGVWACGIAGRVLGVDDHRSIVWDEFVGLWIALLPVLAGPWWGVVLGFALFRLFDVWKPWPIRQLDRRLKGGVGVMVDDVVAGVFAAVVLELVLVSLR